MRIAVLLLIGCSYQHGQLLPGEDGAVDASDAPPPITCGDLTCDPHASCSTAGAPTCRCNDGYTGNGMTCQDIDECATNNGGCPAACANTNGSFACFAPLTCAEIEAVIPGGGNGDVVLYVGNDPTKPWNAFCASGLEYLTLPAGANQNYGQYTASESGDTSVRTRYSRIRLVPATLRVDIADKTFATSTGSSPTPTAARRLS